MISGIKNKRRQITTVFQILSESAKPKQEFTSGLEEDLG
jgi:hypothetical protein